MQTSEQLDKIAPALVKAQGEIGHAVKDSTNPHFKAKYADLGSVWEAVKPALKKNELMVSQEGYSCEAGVGVRTRVTHASGQWMEFEPVVIPLTKRDAHGVGSALTYGRRYGLSAALGVVADDDDGAGAVGLSQNGGTGDAQSTTAPAQVKNAPGISEARNWVRDHLKDLNACDTEDAFLATITAASIRWTKICGVYPTLWTGPDGSGLKGEGQKLATIFQVRPEYDSFVRQIEAAAVELQQPKEAAQ